MIHSIKTTGLKGGPINDTLANVTIWVGGNAAGKSKRLDAVQLSVTAKHPDEQIGGTNAGIMQLSDGRHLHTEMDYGNGSEHHVVTRNWTTTKTGFSCDNDAPCKDFADLLLNPREYFALSAAKQVEFVASKVTVSDPAFTPAGLLAGIKNIRLDENTEASEGAINAVYTSLSYLKATDPLPWLEAALEQVRSNLKAANATRKRMVGVTTGLEQLRAQDTAAEAGTGSVERDLREAREKLAQLQKDAGHLDGRIQAAAKQRARKEALEGVKAPEGVDEAALVVRQNQLDTDISIGKQKQVARTESTEVVYGRLMGIVASRNATIGARDTATRTAHKLRTVPLRGNLDNLTDKLMCREREIANAEGNIGRRLMNTQQLVDRIAELRSQKDQQAYHYRHANEQIAVHESVIEVTLASECCPTCKAVGTEWKERFKAERQKSITEFQVVLATAAREGSRLKTEIETAQTKLAEWRTEDANLIRWKADKAELTFGIAACNEWKKSQEEAAIHEEESKRLAILIGQQDASYDATLKELDALRNEDLAIAELVKQSDTIGKTLRNASSALNQYRAAVAELAAMVPPEAAESLAYEQREIGAKTTAVREFITSLEAKARDIIAQRASLRSQMLAAAAATATEAEIAVLSAAGKLLREKQSSLVALAFAPLLKICNDVTDCIIPFAIEYRDGCIGYEHNGTFVTSASFNGAWQALVFVGLAAALSQGVKEKIIVFDELSRFDQKSKVKLIERMLLLTGNGTVDQFLGNDLDAAAYRQFDGERVKIIEVGA